MSAPTEISTVLVANRGEIAIRIFRTARQMGLRTVAVYVEADRGSRHVEAAHAAVRLPSGSYLDQDAIIDAARRTGADAIHPGYGFLSENASFAGRVETEGLIWVGPPASCIADMGDKLRSKRLAEDAGVPTLPFAEPDPEAPLTAAETVGYPLLVKASAGGGGKGMRVVAHPSELAESIAAARREALAAFGDDRLFFERYVPRSRHVEVQIVGDSHGGVFHLGERECSIQRRHQKLVEEAPSPAVTPALRDAMTDAATKLARAIGYRSLGTVEFLLDDATHEFFFLEMNTRLQVEHPVTEETTGIDLVREQLRIAGGHAFGGLPESRETPREQPAGWAIEARLNAEDPAGGFLPATGTFEIIQPALAPAVRWDMGVATGREVGVAFDPMVGKVIASGATRAEAAMRLAAALDGLFVGGVTTNAGFLANLIRSEEFLAGATTTDFIERVAPAPERVLSPQDRRHAAIAAGLWLRHEAADAAPVLRWVIPGWRNARLPDERLEFEVGGERMILQYRSLRDGSVQFTEGDTTAEPSTSPDEVTPSASVALARFVTVSTEFGPSFDPAGGGRETVSVVDVEIDGLRVRYRVAADPPSAAVDAAGSRRLWVHDGQSTIPILELPRFEPPGTTASAGGAIAPMPGVVLDVRVSAGDAVQAGDTLVVLEAMKMEHHVKAAFSGTVVSVAVRPGDQVAKGAELMEVSQGDDASVAER